MEILNHMELLGDRVLIGLETKEQTTGTGLIIPVNTDDTQQYRTGIVKAVGTGKKTEEGILIAPSVKAGDKVMFQYAKPIRLEDKDYLLVVDSDIVAIL